MSLNISSKILSLPSQRVKHDLDQKTITVSCDRDRRYRVIDPVTKTAGKVNCYQRRTIRDLPLCGFDCYLQVELAQVSTANGRRLLEASDIVDKGNRYTTRFCRLVSGLCRHMSISTVSRHLNLRWETVKNMDKFYLESTLPALDPSQLYGLKYLGVDEVARAKGHDYMTVIYDMESGQLIGVEAGRTADVFSGFLKRLPHESGEEPAGSPNPQQDSRNRHWARKRSRITPRIASKTVKKHQNQVDLLPTSGNIHGYNSQHTIPRNA